LFFIGNARAKMRVPEITFSPIILYFTTKNTLF